MKNVFRISVVILLLLSFFLVHSCIEDKPTPPVITTTAITAISYTTATSGGEVTDLGGAPILSRGVCWNTSAGPTISNSNTVESGGLGSFTSNITQLTPNTMYYLRAYATNIAGAGYGNEVSFTTSQVAVPVLTTTAITSIIQTTAVSGGNITADNGASITAKGVCWGTSANPTIALSTKTTDGTGTGIFTSSIAGLTAATTYFVRAYATNSIGTAYGNELSFITATPAQYSNATLNGPWFIHTVPLSPYNDSLLYVVFNGTGNIIDCSGFGVPSGNYSVASGGAYSGNLIMGSDTYTFSGQLSSQNVGTMTIAGMNGVLSKIINPGALADSLVGTLNTVSCGQKNVTLCLNSQGQVISAIGLTAPVSGRVYTDLGVFAGHLKTGGVSGWNEFSIWGYYSNNSLNGQVGLDWSSCGVGTVHLVRK